MMPVFEGHATIFSERHLPEAVVTAVGIDCDRYRIYLRVLPPSRCKKI